MAFWPDKGRQGGDGSWHSGGKGGRGRSLSARHTLPARTIAIEVILSPSHFQRAGCSLSLFALKTVWDILP